MPTSISEKNQPGRAYVITGPTSGYGLATAQEVAKRGGVVLVGRDREKLRALESGIRQKGGHAETVVCDLSDVESVKPAAAEIAGLGFHSRVWSTMRASWSCVPRRTLAGGTCPTPRIISAPSC
jgi:NAD(P)-dependent dehydrogenase (short-subunit alcohol dehydrogenase family)